MSWQYKVKLLLSQKNLLQRDLAARCNLSVTNMSRYLNCQRKKDNLKVIEKIANALDVPVSYLLDNDDKQITPYCKVQNTILENRDYLNNSQKSSLSELLLQNDDNAGKAKDNK